MLELNSSLANNLNLKKISKEEKPDDFYTFISSFLFGYYEKKLKENISESERESFKRLKSLQIQRSVIKKTIMTIPYNASSIQGIKYLKESFEFDKEYTESHRAVIRTSKSELLEKVHGKTDALLKENEDPFKSYLDKDRAYHKSWDRSIARENENENKNENILPVSSLVSKSKYQTSTVCSKSVLTLETNNVNNSGLFRSDSTNLSNSVSSLKLKKTTNKEKEKENKISWFRHKNDHNIKLESLDFVNLYHGLMFVLNDVFPSLKLLTQYLKDIAYICSKLEISIPWILPTGLVANQSYMKLKDVRIKPLNYSNYTFKLKVADINKLDRDKQIRAFMPNLIHSLDSATLVMLINNYFLQNECDCEYKNIYAIHDCFAVTSKNVDFIMNNLKMIYISLYADKGYLLKLNSEIINHIKNHIGNDFDEEKLIINLYKQNPLKFPDINEVLNEKYDISLVKYSEYIIN